MTDGPSSPLACGKAIAHGSTHVMVLPGHVKGGIYSCWQPLRRLPVMPPSSGLLRSRSSFSCAFVRVSGFGNWLSKLTRSDENEGTDANLKRDFFSS